MLLAGRLHAGQQRDDGSPYVTHPLAVLGILMEHGIKDEDMLVAAVLHDCIEDCGITKHEIARDFGKDVGEIVAEVTKDVNGRFNLRTDAGLILKAADRLHNIMQLESKAEGRYEYYMETGAMIEEFGPRLRKICPALLKELKEQMAGFDDYFDAPE